MQYDALVGQVLIHTPGCSDMLAVDALRKASIQLCEQTQAWRETLTQTAKIQDVDLDVPAHSRAVSIRRVFVDGIQIDPADPDGIDIFAESGTPKSYVRTADNSIRLYPSPDTSVTLTIEVALAPLHRANTFPDDIAERCRMTLINGALSYLFAIPNQAWTNPSLAGAYAQLFGTQVYSVAVQDARGRTRATIRSRGRFF